MSERALATPTPAQQAVTATQQWLEAAVIGLNLCPFAKAVHVKQQVHYACSTATTAEALLQALRTELQALVATDPAVRDTSLLIAPEFLQDFLDFNDFLQLADQLLVDMGLDGVVQIASFHPHYQFAGTLEDDVTNCSNRSPFPTLHLLREDSIDRAVEAFPQAEAIFEKNMQTLQALGQSGWAQLARAWATPSPGMPDAGAGGAAA